MIMMNEIWIFLKSSNWFNNRINVDKGTKVGDDDDDLFVILRKRFQFNSDKFSFFFFRIRLRLINDHWSIKISLVNIVFILNQIKWSDDYLVTTTIKLKKNHRRKTKIWIFFFIDPKKTEKNLNQTHEHLNISGKISEWINFLIFFFVRNRIFYFMKIFSLVFYFAHLCSNKI